MYSIEDIENMCNFDVNKMSYKELDAKYDKLNYIFQNISNNILVIEDKETLKNVYKKLLDSMSKINTALDYYF